MRRIGNRFAASLFALLFVVSLAFGVTTALAQAPSATDCPFDGETFVGTCRSNDHCTEKCIFYNGGAGSTRGDCETIPGCCICQL